MNEKAKNSCIVIWQCGHLCVYFGTLLYGRGNQNIVLAGASADGWWAIKCAECEPSIWIKHGQKHWCMNHNKGIT